MAAVPVDREQGGQRAALEQRGVAGGDHDGALDTRGPADRRGQRVDPDAYGVPGAELLLLHRQQGRRARARARAGRPARAGVPPLRPGGEAATSAAADTTWASMLRPQTGCSTLAVLRAHAGAGTRRQDDDGSGVRAHAILGHEDSGAGRQRDLAPRVGVEPTSLVRIQSEAGPADRPTGESADSLGDRPACPAHRAGHRAAGRWALSSSSYWRAMRSQVNSAACRSRLAADIRDSVSLSSSSSSNRCPSSRSSAK